MSVSDISALNAQRATPGARVREVHDSFHGDLLEVSMGPHHPSTHGVFRMIVTLDGETIVKLKPVFGYLHRNHEKLGETVTYLGSMPYTDRLDYLSSMTNNWAYALAVEKLAGQAVPERAEYVRVILAELTRLLNHTCLAGFLMQDCGCSGTPTISADASETVQKSMAAAPQKIEQQVSKNASNEAKNARSQYGLLLSQEIAKFKQYPPFAKQSKQQGVVLVQVQIDGLGKLIAVNLYQSSNHELLDNQALTMVRKASPFSKPPPDIENKDINLVIPIAFNLN